MERERPAAAVVQHANVNRVAGVGGSRGGIGGRRGWGGGGACHRPHAAPCVAWIGVGGGGSGIMGRDDEGE